MVVKMLYNKESRVIDNRRLIYMLTTPIGQPRAHMRES